MGLLSIWMALVNMYPALRTPGSSLIAALVSVWLLSGASSLPAERKFECAGKNDNGMISVREFPILHFSGSRLSITGSDIFSTYNYEICAEGDSLITFASHPKACPAAHTAIDSLNASNGSFNKVSGLLTLDGAQGMHGEYKCNGATQKY